MQLHQEQRDISSGGIATQRKMSMNLDGTAFKILSDGLYSNKIGSVVRETASNAYDSHIEAGISGTRIEIELPTVFNPTFVVRDFGVGLDEEGVLSVATTYFSSTKRSDNKAIGGFGLGFKSPFSYTDQFTVVATFNGVKRTFSAYMDSAGEPSVALLSSENTDATNGVEVRIPVKSHDISTFEYEVKKQLQFFDPLPIIVGREDFAWPEFAPTYHDPGNYSLVQDNGWRNTWRVVSGPVSFPLDVEQLRSALTDTQYKFFSNVSGYIFVDVGDVIPAPSREALQYNEHTLKALTSKVTHLCTNIFEDITSKIEDSKTLLEATEKYCKLTKGLPWWSRDLIKATVDGVPVTNQIEVSLSDHTVRTMVPQWISGPDRPKLDSRASSYVVYNPDNNPLYFHDDLPNAKSGRQAARAYKYYKDNSLSCDTIFVIRGDIQEFLDQLPGFDPSSIIKMSDCPPPPVKKGVARTQASAKYAYRNGGDYDLIRRARPVSDIPDKGIYAVTHKGSLSFRDKSLCSSNSPIPGDILLIPKTLSKPFLKDPNWMSVEEKAQELLAGKKDEVKRTLFVREVVGEFLCEFRSQSSLSCIVELEDKAPSVLTPSLRMLASLLKEFASNQGGGLRNPILEDKTPNLLTQDERREVLNSAFSLFVSLKKSMRFTHGVHFMSLKKEDLIKTIVQHARKKGTV